MITSLRNNDKNSLTDEEKYRRDVRLSVYVVYFFCARDFILFTLAVFGVRNVYNADMDLSALYALALLFMIALGIKSYSMYSAILMGLILLTDVFIDIFELDITHLIVTIFWLSFIVKGIYAIHKLRSERLLERSLVTHHIITNSIVTCLFLLIILQEIFL